jgi:aryl-alcohol dehydrogenase-like predicted oxidoreductase
LLGEAFDAGVRHFDVARYYGYGEAEGRLGRFIKSRRAEISITTKFGIEPPRRTNALRLAMQAGRRLVQFVPAARSFLRNRAQGLVKGGAFSANDARVSLETSLRELGTDHIDFYLLHDYVVSGSTPEELLEFLTRAVKSGKIRSFGMGTGIENILAGLQTQPELCAVLQFENSVITRNVDKLPPAYAPRFVITHGALSGSYQAVSSFLQSHRDLERSWSKDLALDCSKQETISALMLNYAVESNANGLVLFSSRNRARVAGNMKAVLEPAISSEQVALFGRLVERDVLPSMQQAIKG